MKNAYSLQQEWRLFWSRVPSNEIVMDFIQCDSPKERKALDALAKIGVIGGRQLFRLFNLDKKRLKKMVREKKLVRHEIKLENKIIPIYTLGSTGSIITHLSDCYEPNYWVEYRIEDVLKRILFFNLYQFFYDEEIIPAPDPFVGGISLNNNPLFVYVIRGETNDLINFLKWKKHTFNTRIIIITESFKHIEPILVHTASIKMRITTDEKIANEENSQDLFYLLNRDGDVVKEVQ
ncbi:MULTISPECIES: hypothetical protein [Oceanobacillus]|uniref:hypothetical protein n=1 Tax=Oceanobacillus TaxID=182709 RepID=UPI0005958D8C|nr:MULTISPECIES: hypothetical protein [Oceanobacillus]